MKQHFAFTRSALPWLAAFLGLLVWARPDVVVLVGFSVLLALVGVVGWLLALAVPRLGAEAAQFASLAPGTLRKLIGVLDGWRAGRRRG